MIVSAQGVTDTIGGGTLEHRAILTARAMLTGGPARQYQSQPLGPALGQCCGGAVALLWERFEAGTVPDAAPYARPLDPADGGPAPAEVRARAAAMRPGDPPLEIAGWIVEAAPAIGHPLWIWGAGHIGRALIACLSPVPDLAITWIDTAQDRFPPIVPDNVTAVTVADPAALVRHAPRDADHLILTYSHELDLALCHALLCHDFGGAGLIGSATKWARFRSRLGKLGHSPAQILRIACPIGDPSLGKHPQVIAVGVAAGLLRTMQRRAERENGMGSKAG